MMVRVMTFFLLTFSIISSQTICQESECITVCVSENVVDNNSIKLTLGRQHHSKWLKLWRSQSPAQTFRVSPSTDWTVMVAAIARFLLLLLLFCLFVLGLFWHDRLHTGWSEFSSHTVSPQSSSNLSELKPYQNHNRKNKTDWHQTRRDRKKQTAAETTPQSLKGVSVLVLVLVLVLVPWSERTPAAPPHFLFSTHPSEPPSFLPSNCSVGNSGQVKTRLLQTGPVRNDTQQLRAAAIFCCQKLIQEIMFNNPMSTI